MNIEEFNANFENCFVENLSFADYLKVDALSNSSLEDFLISPAHYKYFQQNSKFDTDATDFGSLVHCAILEPDHLLKRYKVKPDDYDGRTKEGKALKAECEAKNIKLVDSEDLKFANHIASRLYSITDNNLGAIIGEGIKESSVFWQNDGLKFKGRPDLYSEKAGGICIDIKTTRHPTLEGFERESYNRGFHRKAAHYVQGLRANNRPCKHVIFVAIDNNIGPRDFVIYLMLPEIVELGAKQNQKLIDKFKKCKEANEWPCYTKQILELGLPSWAINKLTEDEMS